MADGRPLSITVSDEAIVPVSDVDRTSFERFGLLSDECVSQNIFHRAVLSTSYRYVEMKSSDSLRDSFANSFHTILGTVSRSDIHIRCRCLETILHCAFGEKQISRSEALSIIEHWQKQSSYCFIQTVLELASHWPWYRILSLMFICILWNNWKPKAG